MNRKTGRWGLYRMKDNTKLFFYPREFLKILDKAKPKQRDSLMMLIHTGARHNEARHIKVGDVDLSRKTIIIRVTKVRAKKGEKNPRPRTIPISSQFAKIVKKEISFYG